MNEKRKDFLKRMQDSTDDIADTWNDLVQNGAIKKVMETERKYKQSGGYSELNSAKKNQSTNPWIEEDLDL